MTMFEKIEELCKKDEITIAELSRETGIAPSVFSNLKRRKNNLITKHTYTVSRYFGVPMEQLVGENDD